MTRDAICRTCAGLTVVFIAMLIFIGTAKGCTGKSPRHFRKVTLYCREAQRCIEARLNRAVQLQCDSRYAARAYAKCQRGGGSTSWAR